MIFSRDELKQFEMQQEFPQSEYPGIRYFLGDVRDEARLRAAIEDASSGNAVLTGHYER